MNTATILCCGKSGLGQFLLFEALAQYSVSFFTAGLSYLTVNSGAEVAMKMEYLPSVCSVLCRK